MTKRILVIDDEEGIREIIQISLNAVSAWEVLTAASGEEGLSIAATQQPQAILLDVMMPEMDGVETFKQLRLNMATSVIPTIMLTAKTTTHEQQMLIDLGVTGVISKPFKAKDLVAQIRVILNWND